MPRHYEIVQRLCGVEFQLNDTTKSIETRSMGFRIISQVGKRSDWRYDWLGRCLECTCWETFHNTDRLQVTRMARSPQQLAEEVEDKERQTLMLMLC